VKDEPICHEKNPKCLSFRILFYLFTSNYSLPERLFLALAQMWEEEHLPDGAFIGQQHGQAVHAHAKPPIRGHAVFHCLQEILILRMADLVILGIGASHF